MHRGGEMKDVAFGDRRPAREESSSPRDKAPGGERQLLPFAARWQQILDLRDYRASVFGSG